MTDRRKHRLFIILARDVLIISVSAVLAVVMVRTGTLAAIFNVSGSIGFLESFIAGIFFSSIFTTIPSIAALGELAHALPIGIVAFFGAAGALVGDLIIFYFVRDTLTLDILQLLSKQKRSRLFHIFRKPLVRWVTPLLGALIIASPLPDELAMLVMGSVHIKTSAFIPFSFVANFFGILLIGLIARQLV